MVGFGCERWGGIGGDGFVGVARVGHYVSWVVVVVVVEWLARGCAGVGVLRDRVLLLVCGVDVADTG